MRSRLLASLFGIALAIAPSQILCAAPYVPPTWQEIHDKQPKDIQIDLILDKNTYYQGEKIVATVKFTSDPSEKSNRITGAVTAHVFDAAGDQLTYPFKWREWQNKVNEAGEPFKRYPVYFTDGVFHDYALNSPLSLNLTLNDQCRFDQPGTYTVYIETTRYSWNPGQPQIELVSNKVTFNISSLPTDKEKDIITKATASTPQTGNTSANFSASEEKINALVYLQTAAARDALVASLASDRRAWDGLLAAPNPSVEAAKILNAVKTKGLTLDEFGLNNYAEMKAFPLMRDQTPDSMTKQEYGQRIVEIRKAERAARTEIAEAQLAANPEVNPPDAEKSARHHVALWLDFQTIVGQKNHPDEPDVDGGVARRAIVTHQLELETDEITRIVNYWNDFGGLDFLPLIEKLVKESDRPPFVLLDILAQIKPEEAAPLIIAEMRRPDTMFFPADAEAWAASNKSQSQTTSMVAVRINLKPQWQFLPSNHDPIPFHPLSLPELDVFLRKKLGEKDPLPALSAIYRYGTANLLPDVRKLYFPPDPKRPADQVDHASLVNAYIYLIWLRFDPKAAEADFERDVAAGDNQCADSIYLTLRDCFGWDGSAYPLARSTLNSSDWQVASTGIILLSDYGQDSDIDHLISALERFHGGKLDYLINPWSQNILADAHWHLSDDQKKRLETLAYSPVSK